jgi:hypothetical protein
VKLFKELGEKTGRVLSDFTYVLGTLMFYIVLGLATYIVLKTRLPVETGRAGFIAYVIATGGDPSNFAKELEIHYWSWRWVLAFHIISWLVVPLLGAAAIDVAYRMYERRRTEDHESLLDKMEEVIKGNTKLPVGEAESAALAARKEMEREIRRLRGASGVKFKNRAAARRPAGN